MKKYMLFLVALLIFGASADAQIVERFKPGKYDTSWTNEGTERGVMNDKGFEAMNTRNTFYDGIRMKPCGNFYISVTPVTWLEYWKITNEKAHPDYVSVSKAAMLTDAQKRKFLWYMNQGHDGQILGYREASGSQIMKAHQKIGLHDDISDQSFNHGFFISMSASDWRWWHR